jgi:general secretion pathway protein H
VQAAAKKLEDNVAAGETLLDERGNLKVGAQRPVFKSFKEASLKPVELPKDIRVADVYTPKQREAYSKGRAFLYFFPQGFGERAIIHLCEKRNKEGECGKGFYSLVVHPLTGRVVVQSGYVEIPRDFDLVDDEGNRGAER